MSGDTFERERICLLIESRKKRNEPELARHFARELFRSEIRRVVLQKVSRMEHYSLLLRRAMQSLIALLFLAVLALALNISPLLNIGVEGLILLLITLVVLTDALLRTHFMSAVLRLLENYEHRELSFEERVLDSRTDCTQLSDDCLRRL